MEWFKGSITAAIAQAKQQQSIFMVFIKAEGDESKNMEEAYNTPEVSSLLLDSQTVCIKLDASSTECKQFGQIYPVVVVPSSYYIAVNGIPLEVIGGVLKSSELLEKLKKIQETHKDIISGNQEKAEKQVEAASKKCSSAPGGDQSEASTSEVKEQQVCNAPIGDEHATEDNSTKVERAQELIKIQRAKKLEEEKQKEIEKEKERIKLGQDMQKFKLKQKEEEAKQLAEDLAKEKADDKKARERVKAQIAKDREERAAKFHKEKEEIEKQKLELQKKLREEQEEAESVASQRSTMARLQFRMADGSTLTVAFPADQTLETARKFVCDKKVLNSRSFKLSTPFPRRVFTENDMSMTLRDLQLAPSSVIVLLPVQSALQSADSGLNVIFWSIMQPFVYVFNFVYNFLFGQPDQQAPPSETDSRQRKRNQPNSGEAQPRTSRAYKRQAMDNNSTKSGNIHRLRNNDDDDDENNTWNGNSTQQM